METIEKNIHQEEAANKEENTKQFLFSADNGIGILAIRGLKNHFRTHIEMSENAFFSITRESGRFANQMTKTDKWQIQKEDVLSIHKTKRMQASLLAVASIGILCGCLLHPILFLLTLLTFFGLCKKTAYIQLKNGADIWFYYKEEDTLSEFMQALKVNTGNMRKKFDIFGPIATAVFLGIVLVISLLINRSGPTTPTMVSTPVTPTETLQTPAQFKDSCQYYTYNEVARQPDKYVGKPAFITGSVIQTIESEASDSYVEMRIDVEEGPDTVFYVFYNRKSGEDRFLEGDYVIVYGVLEDLITYESVQGGQITIPAIQAEFIELFDGNLPC